MRALRIGLQGIFHAPAAVVDPLFGPVDGDRSYWRLVSATVALPRMLFNTGALMGLAIWCWMSSPLFMLTRFLMREDWQTSRLGCRLRLRFDAIRIIWGSCN